MSNFDELAEMSDEEESREQSFTPIWALESITDETLHSWLKSEFKFLMKNNRERHKNMIENLNIYRGVQFSPDDQKTVSDFFDISRNRGVSARKHKLIVNHLYDITETIVARSTRNKPAPEVLPANSSQPHDRNAAESVQEILNYITYINRLNMKDINLKRKSLISGVSYMSVLWNKDQGDIHPAWIKAREDDFLDQDGKPIKDEKGKKLNKDNPIKTGEVEYRMWDGWRILLQEKDEWDQVDYCFTIEIRDINELRVDHPKEKDKIKALEGHNIFDSTTMTFRKLRNETIFIKFYHRPTKYLKKGYEIEFTMETLLDRTDYSYEHKRLPIERLTDIDIEGHLHPDSFYEQTKMLQWRHNQLSSDIITNQRMCAKPKWLVPKGRCKIDQLGNAITIVQFSGPVAPRLESPNPTSQEIFNFRRELKEELEQISTVTGTARRNPPTGVVASVAMRFLSELEAERVSVAGTFYSQGDGRTLRVLGNDGDYQIKDMEISNLNKAYDVIIRNTGSLPETRAAREARIFDVLERKPDLFADDELIDALELGNFTRMTSILTEALKASRKENEMFFEGKGNNVPEPAVYEQLITHWKSHVQKLQSIDIKLNADPADIEQLEEHIWLTEFLMIEKAKENPTFESQLANLAMYPIYYREGSGFKPSSKAQQEAVVKGSTNRGESTDVRIGGEEPFDQLTKDEQRILTRTKKTKQK